MTSKDERLGDVARQVLAHMDAVKDNSRVQQVAEADAEADNDSEPANLGKRKRCALPDQATDSGSKNGSQGDSDSESSSDEIGIVEVINLNNSSGEGGSDEGDSDKSKSEAESECSDEEEDSSDGDETCPTCGRNDTMAPAAGPSFYRPRLVVSAVATHFVTLPDSGHLLPGSAVVGPIAPVLPLEAAHTAAGPSTAGSSQPRKKRKTPQAWTEADSQRLIDLHSSGTPWSEIVREFPTREKRDLQKKITRVRRKEREEAQAATAEDLKGKGKTPVAQAPEDDDHDQEPEHDLYDDPEDDLDDEIDDEIDNL